jgi:CheY-like chemotaxis protein
MPGQQSTVSAPHSGSTITSVASINDDPAVVLQQISGDTTVALYGLCMQSSRNLLANVLSKYVQDWLGFQLVEEQHADVVLVDEEDLEALLEHVVVDPGTRPAVIVLCSVETRYSAAYTSQLHSRLHGIVELVAKPFGPNKLAKSFLTVLERTKATTLSSPGIPSLDAIYEQNSSTSPHPEPSSGVITDNLQDMDLSGPGLSSSAQVVQATEAFAASQSSQHAQMAIHGPCDDSGQHSNGCENDSFPFPNQNLPDQQITAGTRENGTCDASTVGPPQSAGGTVKFHVSNEQPDDYINPHILVVEDNVINLRLLETYLRTKRKYNAIENADDGKKAVDAVICANRPFDIIFMDISMPLMNGFEATRAIRMLERQEPDIRGAMIIALTGLASGRDQAEGFESGCDLYMTKPVSFKEVGKLLDNWEMHQRLKGHGMKF